MAGRVEVRGRGRGRGRDGRTNRDREEGQRNVEEAEEQDRVAGGRNASIVKRLRGGVADQRRCSWGEADRGRRLELV